ncbi:MAG: hypothetical protein C0404_06875 [Verrucomicrobia bacterium]|nr:hypothetical protein [Verrucomicrobiota bacterium]
MAMASEGSARLGEISYGSFERSGNLIPRVHAIEFEDCDWVPKFIRDGIVLALGFLFKTLKIYHPAFPAFYEFAGQTPVLDLASGSGTHIEELMRDAVRHDRPLPDICLSDINPNITRFERLKRSLPGNLDFRSQPCDATRVLPDSSRPLLSMFTAFHHLRPAQAAALLANAAARSDGIIIFDPVARTIPNISGNVAGIIFGILAPFFRQGFSWKQFVFSTLIPVIPFMLAFDGVSSALRAYTKSDVEEMIASLPPNDFDWEVSVTRGKGLAAMCQGLLIIGRRKNWR